jgi:hypothetical protein
MNESLLKRQIRSALHDVLLEADPNAPDPAETPAEPEAAKPAAAKPSGIKWTGGATPKPGDIGIVAGTIGRGSYKGWVKSAGARAQNDPKTLMKELGVESAVAGNDLQKALKILKMAVNFNPIMRDAYAGVREAQESLPGGEQVKALVVTMNGVSHRDGKKFLQHTLQGAKNAHFLTLKGALGIGKGSVEATVIYSV